MKASLTADSDNNYILRIMYFVTHVSYRFEAVDRDLHLPLGTGCTIPPQPLRPAPQPRQTTRPRPLPLYAPNTVDYLRMQEANSGPLTPPPFLPKPPSSSRVSEPSAFLFQNEDGNAYTDHLTSIFDSYASFKISEQSKIVFKNYTCRTLPETIQMSSYAVQNQAEMRSANFDHRYYEQNVLIICIDSSFKYIM